ncbi:transposable element Tcb1 transposase [Trichonephila clavipes]|nr:transposable element Tcb1 transposase [Trichonephila clavipes]
MGLRSSPSEKSVNVLDETSNCDGDLSSLNEGGNDGANHTHFVAALTEMTGGLCAWKCLRCQWYDERWTWTMECNDIVFTDGSRFFPQHHDCWIQVWRRRAVFQQDNALQHVERSVQELLTHPIELLPWPPTLSPIENMRSKLSQRLTRDTPPTGTPDLLWQYVEAAWTTVPQGYIQSLFDCMLRRVAAVIFNNSCCTNY